MKYDLKSFTVAEKIRLLAAKNSWFAEDLDGKIYRVSVSDGPVGLRTIASGVGGKDPIPAVAFPAVNVLAQTWRPELAYRTGEMLADECIERGVDILLAPGINIKRLPSCGRNFEYVSEDPYLSGIFGREYIKGVQDHHVGTSLKHYCANNQENSRRSQSSEIDERTLREIYTRNFKIALEAKPWTVMSSYNRVNGVKLSAHKKLLDMLRNDLGFDGIIISDWHAVDDKVASIKSGLDLEFPYSQENHEQLVAAIERGEVSEAELDARCERVLQLVELCESESKLRRVESTVEERREASEKVAEEGIVLLKNNGVLPLSDGMSIAISGEGTYKNIAGDGSSRVTLDHPVANLADELRAELPKSKISAIRYDCNKSSLDIINTYGKDAAIIAVHQIDMEEADRDSIRLPRLMEEMIIETARKNENTIVLLYCGSVIDMTAWEKYASAIISVGYPGERGNVALAKILSGKVNPSGKTTETYPLTEGDCLATHCYRDLCHSVYSDGLLVGYRWYDTAKYMGRENEARVMYPFGHGLSYSTFEYSGLKLTRNEENIVVEFDVTNTSDRDAKEIAQVYFRDPLCTAFRPYKELCGFDKKLIKAGMTEHYTVKVPIEYLSYYSTGYDTWVVEPGDFEFIVGASCEDVHLSGKITL